jgi:cysteine desulfurase
MSKAIYLDYNGTTPVDPEVVEAMLPYFSERFGNASSDHAYGHDASEAISRARSQIAKLIAARPDSIVITSGGSESDNLAIKGAVFPNLENHPHVVSSVAEHPAILATLRYIERRFGVETTLVGVDEFGRVDPDEVRRAIRPNTVLVTIMHANNEVGTIQPIREIGEVAREAGVLFHTDAAQSVGKMQVDVDALSVDMLTVAGHKLYGPKGIGVLFVRKGIQLDPVVHGSGQEHGLRAGTENVASIVGLGKACSIAGEEVEAEQGKLKELRDRLHTLLEQRIQGVTLNGHPVERLCNTLNVSLPEPLGQATLAYAYGVAASTGSACHSGQTEPSSVLTAMGIPQDRALGALRLSLGRWSSLGDVETASEVLAQGFEAARSMSPALSGA